jgi:streptogramin lyase
MKTTQPVRSPARALGAWLCGALLAFSALGAAAQEASSFSLDVLRQLPTEAIAGAPRPLKVEDVGIGAARTWLAYYAPFLELSLYQDPSSGHWMHVIPYKKEGKDERLTHFALVDVDDGTVTQLGSVPGWEEFACAWADQKLYMGMNNVISQGRLIEFDPATKSLRDLKSPYEKANLLRCMAVGPDGALALGGDGPEVAVYDPATKAYTHYGTVGSPQTTKVYYISLDDEHVYAAARGTDPWHLIAVHRKTKEKKELLQVPVNGLLALNRNGVIWTTDDYTNESLPKKHYFVSKGAIHAAGSEEEAQNLAREFSARVEPKARPCRAGPPPRFFKDDSPTFAGKGELKFLYQKPGEPPDSTNVWKEVAFPIPFGPPHAINRIAALADGRVAYSGEKYAPMVVWDPKTGKSSQAPTTTDAFHNSVYSMAAVGNTVFLGGYAVAIVMAFDPDKPLTQPVDLPGRKKVPVDSRQANPRLVHRFGDMAKGAHMAIAMEVGADGKVYLCARRHRYFFGFDICWFDPMNYGRRGVLEAGKALDHYQFSWMCLTPNKQQLVVSTYVEGNPQIDSPRPTDARLFFFDLEERKLAKSVVPLPGVKTLSGIAAIDASTLVGASYVEDQNATVLYRYNLKTGRVEKARKYAGMIHGKPGTTDLPTKGYDFMAGPDGRVWTLTRLGGTEGPQCIVRIDPKDLSIEPVCQLGGGNIRFLFRGKDLLATGQELLQRIEGVVE